ncbi:MAG: transcriptional repressor [Candidatus Omnitrophica bacterium]|nr:transcriptional repressor [Candidatus Omnitrophota bacterium]
MSKEMSVFIEYLKKKDFKLTEQRKEILSTFLKIDKHLSVEELYDIAKKKDPSIGQATVFRTLKLLCDAEIAKEVDLGDGKVRYEHKYGHEHHDHLICTKCGRFIEAVDPEIENLQDELCERFRFKPQRHNMDIFGICKRCR